MVGGGVEAWGCGNGENGAHKRARGGGGRQRRGTGGVLRRRLPGAADTPVVAVLARGCFWWHAGASASVQAAGVGSRQVSR